MIGKEDVLKAANEVFHKNGELFVVDVKVGPGNDIEVFIDSDGRVAVDDCIRASRAIEAILDRDKEDFSLTVSSAGVGQPLKTLRQYLKLIGKSAELVLADGTKILGTLEAADKENITVSYTEKQTAEGKKRPQNVTVTKTFTLGDVKTTREHIDFK